MITTLVRNIAGRDIAEEFPFYGRVEIAEGEARRIPEDVAQAWEDRTRNGAVLIQRVNDEELTGAPAKPKKGRGKKATDLTITDPDELTDLTDLEDD